MGSQTLAQPRIIPEANSRTLEPPTYVGCQVLRLTAAVWRGGILVWLRGKNQRLDTMIGEKSKIAIALNDHRSKRVNA